MAQRKLLLGAPLFETPPPTLAAHVQSEVAALLDTARRNHSSQCTSFSCELCTLSATQSAHPCSTSPSLETPVKQSLICEESLGSSEFLSDNQSFFRDSIDTATSVEVSDSLTGSVCESGVVDMFDDGKPNQMTREVSRAKSLLSRPMSMSEATSKSKRRKLSPSTASSQMSPKTTSNSNGPRITNYFQPDSARKATPASASSQHTRSSDEMNAFPLVPDSLSRCEASNASASRLYAYNVETGRPLQIRRQKKT